MTRDAALSDVMGTMMLLAATLVLVGVTAPALLHDEGDATPPPPDLAFGVEAVAGESRIHLRHAGGAPHALDDLLARVSVNGTEVRVAPLGGSQPWRLGERVEVTLTRPLAGAERVEVVLVSRAAGAALPPAETTVGPPPTAPPSSAAAEVIVQFRDDTDYAIANTSTTLYLQAKVRHPEGRKAVDRVTADLSAVHGSTDVALHDDGTHGDLVAHDGTYSTHFLVPYNARAGVHPVTVTLVDVWGSKAQSQGDLLVVERLTGDANTPYYNKTLFPKMGYLITKDPARNTLTIRFKVLTNDTKIVIGGVEHKLTFVHLEYPAFKPGTVSGTWTGGANVCALPMAFFTWSGEIQNYDVDVDALPYYFRTEWKGLRGATYHTHIEATPPAQYFTLRASEVTYAAGHPWTSHSDCTNAP